VSSGRFDGLILESLALRARRTPLAPGTELDGPFTTIRIAVVH
jgi:hypothetical protein